MAITNSFLKALFVCVIITLILIQRQVSTIKTHISKICTNGFTNPIGISTKTPVFSFEIETKYNNSALEQYNLVVSESISKNIVWESGILNTPLTNHIKYGGLPLHDNTVYSVTVNATVSGEDICSTAYFRTGYIEKPVTISPKIFGDTDISSPLLRHTFFTGSVVSHATLYLSGNCLFRPFINNVAVTDNFIIGTKGFAKAIDVTSLLTSDNNTLGVWLMRDQKDYKNEVPYIQCGLQFSTVEGEGITIDLSSDWIYKQSPVSATSIGEVYDNREDMTKWCDTYSSTANWRECTTKPGEPVFSSESRNLQPLCIRKSRRTDTIEDDLTVYDFGAIISGRIKIKIMGEPAARLIITYAKTEAELEEAPSQDIYIIKGHEIECYEPCFSVRGFRFAKLYIDGVAQLISAEAVVLGTEALYNTSFLCRCISEYKSFMSIMQNSADYSVIPKNYRTLEGMLLKSDKVLLENHFFCLEQFGIKSLANEILSNAFLKIANIKIEAETCKIFIGTTLPEGANELQFEANSVYGRIGVYSRKISGSNHTDYIIPLGFKAKISIPSGEILTLPCGKYISEEI